MFTGTMFFLLLLTKPYLPKYLFSFQLDGFLLSALLPLPAFPTPPMFPEPLLFFLEPLPCVMLALYLENFFLLLTVIFNQNLFFSLFYFISYRIHTLKIKVSNFSQWKKPCIFHIFLSPIKPFFNYFTNLYCPLNMPCFCFF